MPTHTPILAETPLQTWVLLGGHLFGDPMQTQEHIHAVASLKIGGISALTCMSGIWTWLGENHNEIGAVCSIVGMCGLIYSIWRNRDK